MRYFNDEQMEAFRRDFLIEWKELYVPACEESGVIFEDIEASKEGAWQAHMERAEIQFRINRGLP